MECTLICEEFGTAICGQQYVSSVTGHTVAGDYYKIGKEVTKN